MLKMSTKLIRHALSGATMGARWQALFHMPQGFDPAPLAVALQTAVADVDAQMSTWRPDSALMLLNAAPPEVWQPLPARLMLVLQTALAIGQASGGAFDIGVGDAVTAWGFGAAQVNETAIRAALARRRRPAQDVVELDSANLRARKHGPISLDLSGIAKGYGVDRLVEVAAGFGVTGGLFAIDGELRAVGLQPDGTPWTVAIERPDHHIRAAHAILALQDAAVATSGDYRHWISAGAKRLSHTIDPARGGPLARSPASVTVIAATCMAADAWATALMVTGSTDGAALARKHNLDVLFLERDGNDLRETRAGQMFETRSPQISCAMQPSE
ncbi:MAG: FAD:protein FMN transferase [Cypionkella sp.]|uniref:FAD:protein FMN transferase n=1 Tax=Cypionkella sp. TaxID=2811411 RepID=UPI002ABB53B0|nr:FAD:protein FMN transferase [Cypionkella sp.]MDZ4309468.1 FAD:protein FMN transferase [Cypionkella sp.]MDZ4391941.1 FAD:protein FMN transferase [Cypionkella sp.]